MKTRRGWRLAALLLAGAATMGTLVVRRARGLEGHEPPRASMTAAPTASSVPGRAATYDAALAELVKRRELAEVLVSVSPDSWSRRASAAGYQLDYGQLTGDYEGYLAAERSLADAFAVAGRRGGPGRGDATSVGPHLLHAQLSYTLHRFRAVLDDLHVPETEAEFFTDTALSAETKALRGAATFALGDYERGVALLREAVAAEPANPSHAQRLAIALSKLGQVDEANQLLVQAEQKIHTPRGKAWISLQRGLIDLARGRHASARHHLEEARARFPGWWLVDEHLAELDADEGHTEKAIDAYRSLVARTGDPEFMDALARLIADRDPEQARGLLARSHAIYEDRLARLPEASYGHALEHFLQVENDPARTVEIAQKNRELRPDGEARTRLAQAYLEAGRTDEACAEMRAVLASSWRSSESFATAALAFERGGHDADAAAAAAAAAEMNPHAAARLDWLRARRGAAR